MEKEGSSEAKEEYALLCKVPHDLDEKTLDTVMNSKSRKLKYSVREVVGKPIHVQYTLINSSRLRALMTRISGSLVAPLARSGDCAYRK